MIMISDVQDKTCQKLNENSIAEVKNLKELSGNKESISIVYKNIRVVGLRKLPNLLLIPYVLFQVNACLCWITRTSKICI